MAGVFNEMQVGRFNRAMQKLTGVKGDPPVRQIGTEVLPIFPFPLGAEFRYLESWNLFGIGIGVNAGGAGNNSAWQFRNPVGSNVIGVFMYMLLSNNNAAIVDNRLEGPTPLTTDLAAAFTGVRMDGRYGGVNATHNLIISGQSNAAIGQLPGPTVSLQVLMQSNQSPLELLNGFEIPLLPGDVLRMRQATTPFNLNYTVFWRERFLEDSERS